MTVETKAAFSLRTEAVRLGIELKYLSQVEQAGLRAALKIVEARSVQAARLLRERDSAQRSIDALVAVAKAKGAK
jgi:hypothetical protein